MTMEQKQRKKEHANLRQMGEKGVKAGAGVGAGAGAGAGEAATAFVR